MKNWKTNSILILSLMTPLSWTYANSNAQGQENYRGHGPSENQMSYGQGPIQGQLPSLSQPDQGQTQGPHGQTVEAKPPVKRKPGPALTVQSFRCSQKNRNQFSYFNPEDWNTYRTNDVYVHTIKQSGRDIGYAVTSGANLKSDMLSGYSLHVRTYMAKYGTGIYEEIPEPAELQPQAPSARLGGQQHQKMIITAGGQPIVDLRGNNTQLGPQHDNQDNNSNAPAEAILPRPEPRRMQRSGDQQGQKTEAGPQNQIQSLQAQGNIEDGGATPQPPPKPKRMRLVLPKIFPAIENFFVSKTDQWGKDVTALSIITEKESMVRVVCVKSRDTIVTGGSSFKSDGPAYGTGARQAKAGSNTEKTDREFCTTRDMEGYLKIDDFIQGKQTYQVVCSEAGPISSYPEDAFVSLELNNVLNER